MNFWNQQLCRELDKCLYHIILLFQFLSLNSQLFSRYIVSPLLACQVRSNIIIPKGGSTNAVPGVVVLSFECHAEWNNNKLAMYIHNNISVLSVHATNDSKEEELCERRSIRCNCWLTPICLACPHSHNKFHGQLC